MADMTVQDLAALQELTKDKHPGKWSENTALWSIVIILIILALMWYINRIGADKADLAAAVQSTVSRVNSLETATTAQGNDIKDLNKVVSATTQAQGDFQFTAQEMLANLNRATFVPRWGHGGSCRGNGEGTARFVKRANYCLEDQSLQEIDTCG
jgi:hypothetical protein